MVIANNYLRFDSEEELNSKFRPRHYDYEYSANPRRRMAKHTMEYIINKNIYPVYLHLEPDSELSWEPTEYRVIDIKDIRHRYYVVGREYKELSEVICDEFI